MARLPLNHPRARQQQQQRRVTFASGTPTANRAGGLGSLKAMDKYNNDTSSSDEDEARRLYDDEEDEEEQERILSERYGEAGEAPASASAAPSGGKKRKANDQEDEDRDFLNATSGSGSGATAKKRTRPTFTPSDLIGPKGLIRIKNEFPKQVKRYRVPPSSSSSSRRNDKQRRQEREREAAAAFGKSLIGSYRMFCRDLCPSLAFEDVLGRIETFGSKKEVKTYADQMRGDIRREYVESLYGKEKAGSMLQELEHGLSLQHLQQPEDNLVQDEQVDGESGGDVDERNEEESDAVDANVSGTPKEIAKVDDGNISDEEMEATFQEENFDEEELAAEMAMDEDETEPWPKEKSKSDSKTAPKTTDNNNSSNLVDTDDEENNDKTNISIGDNDNSANLVDTDDENDIGKENVDDNSNDELEFVENEEMVTEKQVLVHDTVSPSISVTKSQEDKAKDSEEEGTNGNDPEDKTKEADKSTSKGDKEESDKNEPKDMNDPVSAAETDHPRKGIRSGHQRSKHTFEEAKMAQSEKENEINIETSHEQDLVLDSSEAEGVTSHEDTQDSKVSKDDEAEKISKTSEEVPSPVDMSEEQSLVVDATLDTSVPVGIENDSQKILDADSGTTPSPVDDSEGQTLVVDVTQDSLGLTNETETVVPTLTLDTVGEKDVPSSQLTTTAATSDETTNANMDQQQNTIIEESVPPSQIHFVDSDEEQFSVDALHEEEGEELVVDEDMLTQQTHETATVVPSMTGNTQFGHTQQSMDY